MGKGVCRAPIQRGRLCGVSEPNPGEESLRVGRGARQVRAGAGRGGGHPQENGQVAELGDCLYTVREQISYMLREMKASFPRKSSYKYRKEETLLVFNKYI